MITIIGITYVVIAIGARPHRLKSTSLHFVSLKLYLLGQLIADKLQLVHKA